MTTRVRLGDAEAPIRAALERLAESPRELRCFVIIEDAATKRFVQFCTPPPPSRFTGGVRLEAPNGEPLIFDGTGTGDGAPGHYTYIQTFCDVDQAVALALDTLRVYLPEEAEVKIVEESTHLDVPS